MEPLVQEAITIGVFGAAGSGKSTILNTIATGNPNANIFKSGFT
mgnify:CR=1 FL=1